MGDKSETFDIYIDAKSWNLCSAQYKIPKNQAVSYISGKRQKQNSNLTASFPLPAPSTENNNRPENI